jgi:RmlD substrate binding domain
VSVWEYWRDRCIRRQLSAWPGTGATPHIAVDPMATLAHTEVDIAKSSAVASVPVGMCAFCTAPSEPGARRSGAGISTYHFIAEGITTWHDFASRIVAVQAPLSGRKPRVTPITTADHPVAARRSANSQLDCRLFAKVFCFSGRHWTEAVDMTTKALITSLQQAAHVS